jgi:hypothetical protein
MLMCIFQKNRSFHEHLEEKWPQQSRKKKPLGGMRDEERDFVL